MRVLSGIQPTGRFHWGNYFGAIRQYIALQSEAESAFYFIANLHALTTIRDGAELWQLSTRYSEWENRAGCLLHPTSPR